MPQILFSSVLPLAPVSCVSRLCVALLLASAGAAQAQPIRPDAGTLLDSVRQPGQLVPQAPRRVLPAGEAAPTAGPDSLSTIVVRRVVIEGATLLPEPRLQKLSSGLIGRNISMAELNSVADRITALYVSNGYLLSRAMIPPQDARDGTLRIRVVEAVYGRAAATASGSGVRLDTSRADQVLATQGVASGLPVQRAGLERGLLILNDFPGVQTQASLSPGAAVGSSDLSVGLQEGRLVTGQVGLDNLGGRYTGKTRVTGSLNINDPAGRGDAFRLGALKSSGLGFLSASYQAPVASNGLRLGASVSGLDYRLCCSFAALDARGSVRSVGANASFPFILSQEKTLKGDLSVERRRAIDEASGVEIANRRADVATASLSWLSADPWGGLNSLYGAASFGHLDLSANAPSAAFDSATAQTQGDYARARIAFARLQAWGPSQLLVRMQGQLASKNLDSSEKMSLGGLDGVRAYAQGEAAGDQALLASLEYAYAFNLQVPGRVQGSVFFDAGRTQLNKTTWAGFQGARPNLSNQYSLRGWGIGLRWDAPQGAVAQLILASKLGANPGSLPNGDDIDGRSGKTRLLLVVGLPL